MTEKLLDIIGNLTDQEIEELKQQINNLSNNSKISNVSPMWCAIIFHADKMVENENAFSNNKRRMPVNHIFQFVVNPEKFELDVLSVHPGTNIGKHTRQEVGENIIERLPVKTIEAIRKVSLSDKMFLSGIIEIVYPEKPDEIGEPGYRHFSIPDALKLLKYHGAVSWIDRALVGEIRPEILTVADRQKQMIINSLKRDNS